MANRYGWGSNEPKILPGTQGGDRINFFGIKIKALFADLFAKLNVDANKLDGIQAGAEVNQNAFAKVKSGDVTVEADQKSDTLELVPGSNVTITPDAANDKITIAVNRDFLPLSGGMLSGNIAGDLVDFNIVKRDAAGRLILRGGTTYNNGANLYLNGKDYAGDGGVPGEARMLVSNGAQSSLLTLTPDGALRLNNIKVATEQSNSTYIKGLSVSGRTVTYTRGDGTTGSFQTQDTTYTLASLDGAPKPHAGGGVGQWGEVTDRVPPGGTWAYIQYMMYPTSSGGNSMNRPGITGGIVAGGTPVSGRYLVWRIA